MHTLSQLILLDVSDNPLTNPPLSVCNRGCFAILKYLKEQCQVETSAVDSTAEGSGLTSASVNTEAYFDIFAKIPTGDSRSEVNLPI